MGSSRTNMAMHFLEETMVSIFKSYIRLHVNTRSRGRQDETSVVLAHKGHKTLISNTVGLFSRRSQNEGPWSVQCS